MLITCRGLGRDAARHPPAPSISDRIRASCLLSLLLVVHHLPTHPNTQFAYPFTLEPHLLTVESSRRTTLASHTARRAALLKARDDEKDRRRREALRRIAPGFEPEGAVLTPVRALGSGQHALPGDGHGGGSGNASGRGTPDAQGGPGHQRSRSVMDDLVDQLAAMDSRSHSRTATPGSVAGS